MAVAAIGRHHYLLLYDVVDDNAMNTLLTRWQHSVAQAAADFRQISDGQARRRPAPAKWSIKEIVGHLIDSAANNHRRFVEGQFQDTLVFPGYAQDSWVSGQRYQDAAWPPLVALWSGYNDHLIHVVRTIPPTVLERARRTHNVDELGWRPVPRTEATTLGYVIADYVAHLEHHVAQARRVMTAGESPGESPGGPSQLEPQ